MKTTTKKSKICAICGKTFIPNSNRAKYCGSECSYTAKLKNMRAYSKMCRRSNPNVGTVVLPKHSTNWDIESSNIKKIMKNTFSGKINTANTNLNVSNDALIDGVVDYESSTIMNDVDAFFN